MPDDHDHHDDNHDHHEDHEDHGESHHHHGRGGGKRTLADYNRDFWKNFNDYDAPLLEKVRLTLRNRAKAYLVPPVKGCCGHPGEPGC